MNKKVAMSMNAGNVWRSICQGLHGLRKNRMFTLASIGTVTACLFLVGLFYCVLSNFQYMLQEVSTSVGVTVFFCEGVTETQIEQIGVQIQQRQEVDRIEFVSAEEAWEQFKQENFQDSPELVESFEGDNPLADSASYEIYLTAQGEQDTLVAYLQTLEGIRSVNRSDELAEGISGLNALTAGISFTLIMVLLLVSVFLIHSTIATGIAVRKPEIALMRLMGASDFFIWSPYIVEGIVIGFFGALLPLVVLAVGYGKMTAYVAGRLPFLAGNMSFLTAGEEFSVLVPLCLGIGISIGFLGSFITVRRHLAI